MAFDQKWKISVILNARGIAIPGQSDYIDSNIFPPVSLYKSTFRINKMDCPSEENLIRLQLGAVPGVENLEFKLEKRSLVVHHYSEVQAIINALHILNLDSSLLSTEKVSDITFESHESQKRLLWTVLAINLAFFLIEMSTGLFSQSMGLVADSLDMLADAFVYGISLMAVGGSLSKKKSIARIAGYFQISLALIGFIEIIRRFLGAVEMPDFKTMIIVSILALLANSFCLYILQKSKSKNEAHIRASMIFTSNDVIINIGVIAAAISVYAFNSKIPDLVIGAIVFILVIQGAIRILQLGK